MSDKQTTKVHPQTHCLKCGAPSTVALCSQCRDSRTTELERIDADRHWWETMLPKGWRLTAWTYRTQASAISPTGRSVELDPQLLCAFAGRDWQRGSR